MSGATLTRRAFLKTVATGGAALVIAVHLPRRLLAAGEEAAAPPEFAPGAFLRIGADGLVTIVVARSELGQGSHTAMPMLVAEELEADWSRVRIEQALAHPDRYGNMTTGGSTSVRLGWEPLRRAGAAAREMLIGAAAREWAVARDECRAEAGFVIHAPSGRRRDYGSLVAAAAREPVPQDPPLKGPAAWRLIGRDLPRLDVPAKVDGSAVFGLDVRRPGQLTAAVARCPVFGGRAAAWNEAAARAVPGVRAVVAISSGVAVVADSTWAAFRGREALGVTWDEGAHAGLDSAELRRRFAALGEEAGRVLREEGDFATAFAGAARRLEATYELPFLAHAPLEPMNCTAHVTPEGVEVWAPTQAAQWAQGAAARAADVPPERVRLHTTLSGGAFGRRLMPDFVVEAVEVAKALDAPVQVVWSREDDLRHDFYRPASLHRVAAGLDAAGWPVAWRHRVVAPSISAQNFGAQAYADEPDAGDGAVQLAYGIPHLRVEHVLAETPVPIGWWRSVYNTQNAFVNESFLDECAAVAGSDPLAYRRRLLPAGSRLRAVIERAAAAAGWGTPPPPGRARGLAAHACFGSYAAQVAELSLGADGQLRVHRLTCAVDCGVPVHPDGIRAQMEGCVALALGAVCDGEITLAGGRVRQGNYGDYPIPTMDRMPEVDVHLVASGEAVGGIGEPGLPPVAPAITNALFALTGRRVRRLPLRPGAAGG